MLEQREKVGGLAASETSPNGFIYDIGGHVLFSHYEYFDKLFDKLLGDEYQLLLRESWVWMCERFLPYPFQNNIKYLPKEVVYECLMGVIEAQKQELDLSRFKNFEELIYGVFGKGIAKYFMMPYNFKVWAHPPKMMNKEWIGERVSVVDIARVLGQRRARPRRRRLGPELDLQVSAPRRHRRPVRPHAAVRAGQPAAQHRRCRRGHRAASRCCSRTARASRTTSCSTPRRSTCS